VYGVSQVVWLFVFLHIVWKAGWTYALPTDPYWSVISGNYQDLAKEPKSPKPKQSVSQKGDLLKMRDYTHSDATTATAATTAEVHTPRIQLDLDSASTAVPSTWSPMTGASESPKRTEALTL
jgi:hypothetical protein